GWVESHRDNEKLAAVDGMCVEVVPVIKVAIARRDAVARFRGLVYEKVIERREHRLSVTSCIWRSAGRTQIVGGMLNASQSSTSSCAELRERRDDRRGQHRQPNIRN